MASWVSRTGKSGVLTFEEERALLKRAKKGDVPARQALVVDCIPMVRGLAAGYMRQMAPAPFEDFVQEGLTGINRAIDKFKFSSPVRFGTYARWWAKSAMQSMNLKERHGYSENRRMFFPEQSSLNEIVRSANQAPSDEITYLDLLVDPDPLPDERAAADELRRAIYERLEPLRLTKFDISIIKDIFCHRFEGNVKEVIKEHDTSWHTLHKRATELKIILRKALDGLQQPT